MAFSKNTEKLVNGLIQAEYNNACDKFGEKYHSLHEGYAVLLEEVEEVKSEISFLDMFQKDLWRSIKWDSGIERSLKQTTEHYLSAIKELAQVGAVLMKMQNTISEVEENDN